MCQAFEAESDWMDSRARRAYAAGEQAARDNAPVTARDDYSDYLFREEWEKAWRWTKAGLPPMPQ